jgi:hypothetical protein
MVSVTCATGRQMERLRKQNTTTMITDTGMAIPTGIVLTMMLLSSMMKLS